MFVIEDEEGRIFVLSDNFILKEEDEFVGMEDIYLINLETTVSEALDFSILTTNNRKLRDSIFHSLKLSLISSQHTNFSIKAALAKDDLKKKA